MKLSKAELREKLIQRMINVCITNNRWIISNDL